MLLWVGRAVRAEGGVPDHPLQKEGKFSERRRVLYCYTVRTRAFPIKFMKL